MTIKMTMMASMLFGVAAASSVQGQDADGATPKPPSNAAINATLSAPDIAAENGVVQPDPLAAFDAVPGRVDFVAGTKLTLFLGKAEGPFPAPSPLVIDDDLIGKVCVQQFAQSATGIMPFACFGAGDVPNVDILKAESINTMQPKDIMRSRAAGEYIEVVSIDKGTLGGNLDLQIMYSWHAKGGQVCADIMQSRPDAQITPMGCRNLRFEEVLKIFPNDGPTFEG